MRVEQLRETHPAIDRVVVCELERRGVLEPQLGGDPPLQEAVRGIETVEARGARLVVAQDAHVDPGMAQVGTCLDGSHGDEPDTRVLELLGDGVAEDGANRLVDATHATAAHPSPRIGSAYPERLIGERDATSRAARRLRRAERESPSSPQVL